MALKKLFFISDIHIGSNRPTNWYQNTVHAPYLECILKFIRDEQSINNDVQELVILGDLVDQWMYPPDETPPDFYTIVKSNPELFSSSGAFMNTLDVLNGNITYINGNHDQLITPANIATMKSSGGYSFKTVDSLFYTPDNCNNQLICTHGHPYSLLNAPSMVVYPPNNQPLPLGFFVSRLAARWSSQHFTRTQPNAAYMKDSGNPNGAIFTEKALEGIWSQLSTNTANISSLLMAALLNATNNVDKSFNMPVGPSITVDAVKTLYKSCYSDYPASTQIPGMYFPTDLDQTRLRALLFSDANNDLGEFARFLATNHSVVVLGHTHVSLNNLIQLYSPTRNAIYCNSGFNCPSIPDMETDPNAFAPTFVEVDADQNSRMFTVVVYKVTKNGNDYTVQVKQGPLNAKM